MWTIVKSWGAKALGLAVGNKIILIAAGVAIVAIGGLWLWNRALRAELELTQIIAADNAKVIRITRADVVQGNRLSRELREKNRSLEEGHNEDVRRIYAAAKSNACVNSPAWRAFIEGAQPAVPGASGTAPGRVPR